MGGKNIASGRRMRFTRNLLQDLLEARTVGDLYSRAKSIARELEFEHFIYGARLHLGAGNAHEFVLSGYPAAWRDLYEQQNYLAIDPTVAHCQSSNLPLVWSSEYFAGRGAAALMENARQFGLRSGVTMPVHSSNLQTGLLSLASENEAEDINDDVERLAYCQLFATYIHEAACQLMQKKACSQHLAAQLTQREKECLSWAAAGKSSWEISRIVSASERTVNFHIGNVIKKLDVTSRSQAVARALASGLIHV